MRWSRPSAWLSTTGAPSPCTDTAQLRLAEGVMPRRAPRRRQRPRGRHEALLAQDLHRDLERGVGGRHAAVDRALHQRLLDRRERDAAADRGAAMQLELLPARQPHRHAEDQQAPRRRVEAGPAPDVVPGVARDQILELGVERVRVVERLVDPGIAEHRAAVLRAAVEIVERPRGARVADGGAIDVIVRAAAPDCGLVVHGRSSLARMRFMLAQQSARPLARGPQRASMRRAKAASLKRARTKSTNTRVLAGTSFRLG